MKVVLARRTDVSIRGRVDPLALLEALQERDPRAYQLLLQMPSGASFLGSTPECLYTRTGSAVASEAVAGTRARGAGASAGGGWCLVARNCCCCSRHTAAATHETPRLRVGATCLPLHCTLKLAPVSASARPSPPLVADLLPAWLPGCLAAWHHTAGGDVEKDFWLAFDLLRSHKDHVEFTVVRDWVRQALGGVCESVQVDVAKSVLKQGAVQHLYGKLSAQVRSWGTSGERQCGQAALQHCTVCSSWCSPPAMFCCAFRCARHLPGWFLLCQPSESPALLFSLTECSTSSHRPQPDAAQAWLQRRAPAGRAAPHPGSVRAAWRGSHGSAGCQRAL